MENFMEILNRKILERESEHGLYIHPCPFWDLRLTKEISATEIPICWKRGKHKTCKVTMQCNTFYEFGIFKVIKYEKTNNNSKKIIASVYKKTNWGDFQFI